MRKKALAPSYTRAPLAIGAWPCQTGQDSEGDLTTSRLAKLTAAPGQKERLLLAQLKVVCTGRTSDIRLCPEDRTAISTEALGAKTLDSAAPGLVTWRWSLVTMESRAAVLSLSLVTGGARLIVFR